MIEVQFNANGSATLLGRLCTRDGTGAASPLASEGNLNLAADYGAPGSLVVTVVNEGVTPPVQTYQATLVPSAVVQSSLQTAGIWANVRDRRGGNFLADLPPSAFPAHSSRYRVWVQATTSGGTVGWGSWVGPAAKTPGS